MPKQKPLVERIPDQVIVRLFRDGRLQLLKDIEEDPKTRALTLIFKDGTRDYMTWLKDLGWIPAPAPAEEQKPPCQK